MGEEQMKIAIYDQEIEYASRLMAYVNRNTKGNILMLVMVNIGEIGEFLRQDEDGIVIVDERYRQEMEEIENGFKRAKFLWITETKQSFKEKLYRYDSASDTLKKLLYMCETEQKEENKSEINVFLGYTSKNLKAETVRNIARKEYGLYVEMVIFSEYEENVHTEELLYQVKQRNKEKIQGFDKYIIWKDEVAVLPAPRSFFDYREMKSEDINWMIQQLVEEGYRKIYINMDFGIVNDISVLTCFSHLWYVGRTQEWEHSINEFIKISEISPNIEYYMKDEE